MFVSSWPAVTTADETETPWLAPADDQSRATSKSCAAVSPASTATSVSGAVKQEEDERGGAGSAAAASMAETTHNSDWSNFLTHFDAFEDAAAVCVGRLGGDAGFDHGNDGKEEAFPWNSGTGTTNSWPTQLQQQRQTFTDDSSRNFFNTDFGNFFAPATAGVRESAAGTTETTTTSPSEVVAAATSSASDFPHYIDAATTSSSSPLVYGAGKRGALASAVAAAPAANCYTPSPTKTDFQCWDTSASAASASASLSAPLVSQSERWVGGSYDSSSANLLSGGGSRTTTSRSPVEHSGPPPPPVSVEDRASLSLESVSPEIQRLLRSIPRKSREAMTPSDEAAFRTCHPQYSRNCYILMHLGYDIRLGESGRAMLKKEISRRLKTDSQLRERCVSIVCRLKNANVLQLLQMAEISGCLHLGLRISSGYWKEYARKQRPGSVLRRSFAALDRTEKAAACGGYDSQNFNDGFEEPYGDAFAQDPLTSDRPQTSTAARQQQQQQQQQPATAASPSSSAATAASSYGFQSQAVAADMSSDVYMFPSQPRYSQSPPQPASKKVKTPSWQQQQSQQSQPQSQQSQQQQLVPDFLWAQQQKPSSTSSSAALLEPFSLPWAESSPQPPQQPLESFFHTFCPKIESEDYDETELKR